MLLRFQKILASEARALSPYEQALGVIHDPEAGYSSLTILDFHANQRGNIQGGILAAMILLAAEQANSTPGVIPIHVATQFLGPVRVGETVQFAAIGTQGRNFRRFEPAVCKEGEAKPLARGSAFFARASGYAEQSMPSSSARQLVRLVKPSAPRGQENFQGFGGLNPYCRWLGFEYESVGLGEVDGYMDIRDIHRDNSGRIHPGVLVSALDSIAGDAILSYFDPQAYAWVPAVHLAVALFGNPPGKALQRVTFSGHLESAVEQGDGRVLAMATGEIRGPDNFLLARAELLSLAMPK